MRLTSTRAIASLFVIWAAAFAVAAQGWSQNVSPLEKPTGFVNDYAGVIDAATKQSLEAKIKEFRDRSGVELAVAVVRTTGDRDIFDYSLAVARGWGIGAKTDDNPGALLLVAVDDRKYFTQISKDLEDELPDGIAGSLQRQYLVPEFRKGNYGKGIADTIAAYIDQIENRTSGFNPPPAATTGDEDGTPSLSNLICCLAIFIFIVAVILSNRNRSKSDDDQDRWGGGGGGVMDVLPWIILSGSGSGGSSSGSSWGGSSDWGSSGSDWGGFGGGGDFGGGGAGGSW